MHRLPHLDAHALARALYVAVIAAGVTGAAAAATRGRGEFLATVVLASVAVAGGLAWAAEDRALRRRNAALAAEVTRTRRELTGQLAELRQAESRARRAAEQASRARDEFVATVSHELRTPLNAVLGWSRLLRLGKLDAATSARAVESIERSAATQAQIVDEVLDVSRILRGELRLEIRPMNLIPVIEAAVEATRAAASARRIVVARALSADVGWVAGDALRLQQVTWNLLANAVKFTPVGGRVEVRLERSGEEAVISVRDTGIGIDPAFVPHLFERFRQADSSATRGYGGLGLGLAMVRHLIEAHGGAVDAKSEGRGRGATFTVRLPIATAQRGEAAPPLPPPNPTASHGPWPLAGLSRLRVLVVDDDPDSREVVREVLEQAGAMVAVAGSAQEALLCIAQRPPDVLLSDLGMPGEDGYQLMRQVRALDPGAGGAVPAAALTAYTQAENRLAAQEAGFQGYLSKPIDPAELTVAVARLAGRLH
ncbi:MAG TPA: ATP-binding protein [Anaeromyxobacter sp.]|nr:ATP-binding protein [Anaeromyxobacter sp.]